MAKYTLELNQVISLGYQIFDDTWSTFVPSHKKELCDKIVRHYWFNEIGAETPDRFKHYLNEQLALEMPYYNKLYESELWKLFPLYNHILETEGKAHSDAREVANQIGRRDTSQLRDMGEALHRDLQESKWGELSSTTHELTHTIGNLVGDHTEKETIDTAGTKDYTKKQNNKLDETDDRDIKTVEHSDEVIDDDTTGHTNENENTSGTRRYSDTPQGMVTSAGGLSIDAQYLTNYDTTTGNRSLTRDDNGTDDRTTTFDKTTTTNDDLIKEVTEDNTETYDEDTTSNTVRDKSNHDVEDTTNNRESTTTVSQTTHDTLDSETDEFKQVTEKLNGADATASASDTTNISDSKNRTMEQGTVGISRVELLKEYRNAVINIDQLIVRSLAENFMGVF